MRGTVGAAGILLFVAWSANAQAAGVSVEKATKTQQKAAQKAFQAGDEAYDAKKFEEALSAYRASYDIVASPNSRLMVARALRELGKIAEAYDELRATIADAQVMAAKDEKYKDTEKAANDDLEALKERVALVTIKLENAPPQTKVKVGDREVEASTLANPLVLAPGNVTIVATTPDGRETRRDVTLEAGKPANVSLDMAPATAPGAAPAPMSGAAPPPSSTGSAALDTRSTSFRTWAYVAGGVGAVGLVTFAVFGALDSSKYSELSDACPNNHCSPSRADDIDAGRRDQLIANVGLGIGVVGLAAGTVLFLMSSPRTEQTRARSTWVAVGPGNVRVGGAF